MKDADGNELKVGDLVTPTQPLKVARFACHSEYVWLEGGFSAFSSCLRRVSPPEPKRTLPCSASLLLADFARRHPEVKA